MFRSRKADRLKLIYWDGSGLVMAYKRLEEHTWLRRAPCKRVKGKKMELVLAADPMCSWCYGFGKQMGLLLERRPDASLKIVLGGLRAGATDVLDDAGK